VNTNITCLSAVEYANRCDVVFMRDIAEPYVKNSKLSDIKDGCTIYCWSTLLNGLFEYLNTTQVKDIILLSGDNDHSVNPNGCFTTFPGENITQYVFSAPKNIKKWYAQNAEVVNDFIIPMPIGLTPPWSGSSVFNIDGINNNKVYCDRTELLYVNFGETTNPIQRKEIQTLFQNMNAYGNTDQYYKDLQKYKYVLCPPGNGKDSHRIWESIYFGAIPIVEDSSMSRYFAKYFPILIVARWSDITDKFLLKNYNKIKSKFKNSHLLDVDEWFKCQKIGKI